MLKPTIKCILLRYKSKLKSQQIIILQSEIGNFTEFLEGLLRP